MANLKSELSLLKIFKIIFKGYIRPLWWTSIKYTVYRIQNTEFRREGSDQHPVSIS
jgi:hypothetical protein